MKFSLPRLACLIVLLSAVLPSCSSPEELKKRKEKQNEAYSNYDDKRRIRREARQERTDMWYDRQMGKPPKTDTGLKLPGDP